MPTGNMQLDCGTLYYKSNGEYKKICDTEFSESLVVDFDKESHYWSTMPFIAEELVMECEVRVPWYKFVHLAKHGKNKRIRKKNAMKLRKAVAYFVYGIRY